MHKVNAGLTLLLPVAADRLAALEALLVELNQHQERLPFEPSATTHFATITTFPATKYRDEPLPPILLFATSYAGPTEVHVRELVAIMGAGLRQIFEHCVDFEPCSDDGLVTWMLERDKDTTFYSGMQHMTRADVFRNKALREAIGDYLDTRREVKGETAIDARRDIQKFVRSRPDLAWTQEPWKPTLFAQLTFYRKSLMIEGIAAALILCTIGCIIYGGTALTILTCVGWGALLAFIVFVIGMLVSIREAEDRQTYFSPRPSDERARVLAATQMRPVVNEFTLGGPIKEEGDFRPLILRIGLWVIARYSDGLPGLMKYTGISIPTVVTARWITCDQGRRLLFISNYTNDGVGYVRDFIETKGGAERINISFGFGHGYPRTRWVLRDGAVTDPNTYLWSLAENQSPTLFWYGPYRDISIDNIKRDRAIREGLFGRLNEKKAQAWLHLL